MTRTQFRSPSLNTRFDGAAYTYRTPYAVRRTLVYEPKYYRADELMLSNATWELENSISIQRYLAVAKNVHRVSFVLEERPKIYS